MSSPQLGLVCHLSPPGENAAIALMNLMARARAYADHVDELVPSKDMGDLVYQQTPHDGGTLMSFCFQYRYPQAIAEPEQKAAHYPQSGLMPAAAAGPGVITGAAPAEWMPTDGTI